MVALIPILEYAMLTNAYVLKPLFLPEAHDEPVAIVGIIPMAFAKGPALESFLHGKKVPLQLTREENHLVLERTAIAHSPCELLHEAWGFATELKTTFGLPDVQVF
jgi:hypothetical protein